MTSWRKFRLMRVFLPTAGVIVIPITLEREERQRSDDDTPDNRSTQQDIEAKHDSSVAGLMGLKRTGIPGFS
jgi:hypothetical protein